MNDLRNIALQKIGRNVVNFQKIEGMLKFIISRNNFKAPISKIAEILEERKKSINKKSLGTLTSEYFKSFHHGKINDDAPIIDNEAWISLTVKYESENVSLPQEKAAFSFLVSERNRLIHQMLVTFNPESKESCAALIKELDEQNVMIQKEYKNIQNLLIALEEAKKELFKIE
jgi:hypothetical protein